ncbi:MAG: transposase [Candidatus Peribacteraceae bacterium]|nr:transposase [Candidatus Peribacteraceae bacterium]MDD5074623.1 transposase [Candidatus Peribacteraceae bacterium]
MAQSHSQQEGTFHITTNAKGKIPWCTLRGVPEILINNLIMTRNIHGAKVYAFCILTDHVHMVVSPGERGLSAFMHSFKRNSSWHIHRVPLATTTAGVHEPQLWKILNSRIPAVGIQDPQIPAIDVEKIHWENGFHSRIIQDTEQRSTALTYVHYNAWRHGLCTSPEDWPWSSLRFVNLLDPTEIRLD